MISNRSPTQVYPKPNHTLTTPSQVQQKLAPNVNCWRVLVLAVLTGFICTCDSVTLILWFRHGDPKFATDIQRVTCEKTNVILLACSIIFRIKNCIQMCSLKQSRVSPMLQSDSMFLSKIWWFRHAHCPLACSPSFNVNFTKAQTPQRLWCTCLCISKSGCLCYGV